MRNLRLGEGKCIAQDHIDERRWSLDLNSLQSDASTWVLSHCAMLPPVLNLLLFLYHNTVRRGDPVRQPRPIFLGVTEGLLTCTALPKRYISCIFISLYSYKEGPQNWMPSYMAEKRARRGLAQVSPHQDMNNVRAEIGPDVFRAVSLVECGCSEFVG